MHEEVVTKEVGRAAIPAGERGHCTLCSSLGIATGSDFEWQCLILKDGICETHCTEVQERTYPDTRQSVGQLIEWNEALDGLLEICARCPYRNGVRS